MNREESLQRCRNHERDCNNITRTGACIALNETKPNCKFYCSYENTKPRDRVFHVKHYYENGEEENG